jgi:hypothetical protein
VLPSLSEAEMNMAGNHSKSINFLFFLTNKTFLKAYLKAYAKTIFLSNVALGYGSSFWARRGDKYGYAS